jgi:hypothetical protein
MQPIPLAQIDRRHPGPPPSIITLVVALDLLHPERACLLAAGLAEADVDQEIAVVLVGVEVRRGGLGSPGVDGGSQ